MSTETYDPGRSADDILEAESGGLLHRAVALVDLQSALYTVGEEFAYDESPPAPELVRLCRELDEYVCRLSLTKEAALTQYRECSRCSGNGGTSGEPVCIECDGAGKVHAEEADG